MALTAPDWETLREKIQEWLYKIPEVVASTDPMFVTLTGLTQATLKKNWDGGGILTSCNSFVGHVAQEIGVPRKSCLAKGVLDISAADKEVPGCWVSASSTAANPMAPGGWCRAGKAAPRQAPTTSSGRTKSSIARASTAGSTSRNT